MFKSTTLLALLFISLPTLADDVTEIICIDRPSPYELPLVDADRFIFKVNISESTVDVESSDLDFHCQATDLFLNQKRGAFTGEPMGLWNFTCQQGELSATVLLEDFRVSSKMLPKGSGEHLSFMALKKSEEKLPTLTLGCIVQ